MRKAALSPNKPYWPKISIVTPSYNQAKFLEKTILSVIEQSYPNIEYVIIDGGSTDESVDIIRKYEKYLSYWVSEKDKGQSHAINKGLQRCSGDYFGWLNSDDYLEPGALHLVAEAFTDPEVGTVYGKLNVIGSDGVQMSIRGASLMTFELLLNGDAQINQPGAFHRKSLLDKLGGVDENLHYVMDYELWLRLGKYSTFRPIDMVVANHLFHVNSKTCSAFLKFLPEICSIRRKYNAKLFCRKTFNLWRCRFGFWRKDFILYFTHER